jgi:hypothetical protein
MPQRYFFLASSWQELYGLSSSPCMRVAAPFDGTFDKKL